MKTHDLSLTPIRNYFAVGGVLFSAALPLAASGDALVAGPGDTIGGKVIIQAWMPANNDQGQVVFHARYSEDGQEKLGLFTPDELLVAAGDEIEDPESGLPIVIDVPQIASDGLNDAGVLAFLATFHDGLSSVPGRGFFTVDLVTGTKRLVLRTGDSVAGLTLDGMGDPPVLNDSGTMVFMAREAGNEWQLFSYDLSTGVGKVLVPPGFTVGGKTLNAIGEIGFNDSGDLRIRGGVLDGGLLRSGIFELPEFFLESGDVVGSAVLDNYLGCPSLNDLGVMIFFASLDGETSSGILDRQNVLIRQGDVVAGETLTFVGCGSINNHGDIVFEGSYNAGDGIFLLEAPDDDADGIADSVEDSAPNGGDGNGDGIQDSNQENVASFPNSNDRQFVSIASPSGSILENVIARENPSPSDTPVEAIFPIGFLDFKVTSLAPGAATTVEIFLPAGTIVNQYLKFGSEPTDPTPHWYPFTFDGTTGAVFYPEKIVLHFVDGQRGDDDLNANGVIVDPGAPVLVPDSDGDGIDDVDDACPQSDMRASIWIGGRDTGVGNELLPDGCTLSDLIQVTLAQSGNGNSEIVALLLSWKANGIITGREMGACLKEVNAKP